MAAVRDVDPGTLDFIYQATKDGPEYQKRDVDALDAKTIQIFAAASVIVGLTSLASNVGGVPTTILFIAAMMSYALCMYFTLTAIRVRDYFNVVHAEHLWPEYWNAQPQEIKHALVENIAEAYSRNQTSIEAKAQASQGAIYTAGIEALLVGAGLVISRL